MSDVMRPTQWFRVVTYDGRVDLETDSIDRARDRIADYDGHATLEQQYIGHEWRTIE